MRSSSRLIAPGLLGLALAACTSGTATEHHAFIARLGTDTVSVETIARTGNKLTIDGVDRFPRVRQRHTEITLAPDGGIQHLAMDITTPSEPEKQRSRHVIADVTGDSIIMTKRDAAAYQRWAFANHDETVMAHVPQMYSLYELYFEAGLRRIAARHSTGRDTAQLHQFYIDREFDKFPTHHGTVTRRADGKAEIYHDWLAGIGEATIDSAYRLQHYSGARTTYKIEVERLSALPNVKAIGEQFAQTEAKQGGVKQLSVRDTMRAAIGGDSLTADYGRPLARGRQLLGDVIAYDDVWRTGANAATQFSTSKDITVGTLKLAAGTYTLWTMPHKNGGVDLIVNKQTGQWGTEYDGSRDLGRTPMKVDSASAPVDEFTISVQPANDRSGTLVMEWGPFKWSVPITVADSRR